MNFDSLMVAAPVKASANAKWWPDLYLKKGRTLQLITPEQCAVVREIYNGDCGASQIRNDICLYDETGEKIGFVSYNGRVWLNDVEGNIEVPQEGVKTAAQREIEGWGAK